MIAAQAAEKYWRTLDSKNENTSLQIFLFIYLFLLPEQKKHLHALNIVKVNLKFKSPRAAVSVELDVCPFKLFPSRSMTNSRKLNELDRVGETTEKTTKVRNQIDAIWKWKCQQTPTVKAQICILKS